MAAVPLEITLSTLPPGALIRGLALYLLGGSTLFSRSLAS